MITRISGLDALVHLRDQLPEHVHPNITALYGLMFLHNHACIGMPTFGRPKGNPIWFPIDSVWLPSLKLEHDANSPGTLVLVPEFDAPNSNGLRYYNVQFDRGVFHQIEGAFPAFVAQSVLHDYETASGDLKKMTLAFVSRFNSYQSLESAEANARAIRENLERVPSGTDIAAAEDLIGWARDQIGQSRLARHTGAAEKDAEAHLTELMRFPKQKNQKQSELQAECHTLFGCGINAFGRAWVRAKDKGTTHASWTKRGPPGK